MGESLSWSHKEGNSLDQGVDEKNRNKEDDGLKVVEVEAQLMASAKMNQSDNAFQKTMQLAYIHPTMTSRGTTKEAICCRFTAVSIPFIEAEMSYSRSSFRHRW